MVLSSSGRGRHARGRSDLEMTEEVKQERARTIYYLRRQAGAAERVGEMVCSRALRAAAKTIESGDCGCCSKSIVDKGCQ